MYSLGSSKKICMYWGVVAKVLSFSVDIVGGREKSEAEDETGVTERRNPNQAHPGGYSQRDALSWGASCGWGSRLPYRRMSGFGRGPSQVFCDGGS